jgi:mercuric ion transport protein
MVGSNIKLEVEIADAMNAQEPRRLGLLAIPGALVSLLPVLACSWSGIAVLISSLGLGFLSSSKYLLPVTGTLLAVAIVGLSLQIKSRGYVPLVLGIIAVATILPGMFLMGSEAMIYGGVALLMVASAWSLVPRRLVRSNVTTQATNG